METGKRLINDMDGQEIIAIRRDGIEVNCFHCCRAPLPYRTCNGGEYQCTDNDHIDSDSEIAWVPVTEAVLWRLGAVALKKYQYGKDGQPIQEKP